jgi:hypothetical protein
MKMQPWFKTLLVFTAVIGPMYWLMFTADGQRRVDAVMLHVFGDEAMLLDLKGLNSRLSEAELQQVYPQLDWQCARRAGEWGDRECAAALALWNDMPARQVSFWFGAGRLNAMQMDYLARYHSELITQLRHQLGRPSTGSDGGAEGVLQWVMASGMVVIKAELGPADQAALIWVSPPQLQADARLESQPNSSGSSPQE